MYKLKEIDMKLRYVNILTIALTIFVLGCGCRQPKGQGDRIAIGSKNFTEQLIIGEMMAQIIEAKTDLEVKRIFNLGGTMICHQGLIRGELDIYAEYTGTALTAILKKEVIPNPDKAFRIVSEAYLKQYRCRWLKPFGFNNTYAITVQANAAEQQGWKNISDLVKDADRLVAGFTAEFMEREDGYKGLQELYKLKFKGTRDMEPSLMYKAIAQKNVDVICAFATDGRIKTHKLRMLADDRGFFPPYYAAPVVRQETLEQHPELNAALESLSGLLDDGTMRRLNNEVDQNKRDPSDVVAEFLQERGLRDVTRERGE